MAAGYSGKPLATKLGIKPDTTVMLWQMPKSVRAELAQDLASVKVVQNGTDVDFIHAFVQSQAELKKGIRSWKKVLAKKTGVLWISWPKKTGAIVSDLSDREVREMGLSVGLVDVKVCAIDADWSGLKFVFRKT